VKKKKIVKTKDTDHPLKKFFNSCPTYCTPWSVSDKRFARALDIDIENDYQARPWASFQWSEQDHGFGEFAFRTNKQGKIECHCEGESKEFLKKMLCKLVDAATITD
jgi:hypothetical protein